MANDSPLLQYAREQKTIEANREAQMGAKAIGFKLAQDHMAQDKAMKEKTQKLELLGGMYTASKDPGVRTDLLRQIGTEAGFDVSSLISYESALAKDLANLVTAVNSPEAQKNPALVAELFRQMQLKHPGRAPATPERTYKTTLQSGEEVMASAPDTLDYAASIYKTDAVSKAATDAAGADKAKENYEWAKEEWTRLFNAYKKDLPANLSMMGDIEAFMNRAKEDPRVIDDILSVLKPLDKIAFEKARTIMLERGGVSTKPASADDLYNGLNIGE